MSTLHRTQYARPKLKLRVRAEVPTSLTTGCSVRDGVGLASGAGHKVKALKPCWTVMCVIFLVACLFSGR